MEDAETRARSSGHDPVAAGVAAFLAEHIEKERGHDDWLLEDLELLGFDRSAVLARVPSATVASLVGSHYYWARHCHPVAILGYIAVMEGHPPSPELIDRLVAGSGYPRAAFRAFAVHGELDLEHRADLYDAIDGLPLEPAQESLMGLAAMATVELLTRSLEEIVEGAT